MKKGSADILKTLNTNLLSTTSNSKFTFHVNIYQLSHV